MNLKLFLFCVLAVLGSCVFAMEDVPQYCLLCKGGIIDYSSAVIVYENGNPFLVHAYCFKKYSLQDKRNCVCDDLYYDSDDEAAPARVVASGPQDTDCQTAAVCCCYFFEQIVQALSPLFCVQDNKPASR